MNNIPRKILCRLITEYEESLCDDPPRCKALLRDFCGQYRSEISTLISTLQEGVVSELRSTSRSTPIELLLPRLSKRLQDNLSLSKEAAEWSVESWAMALGVTSEPIFKNPESIQNSLESNSPEDHKRSLLKPEKLASSDFQSGHTELGFNAHPSPKIAINLEEKSRLSTNSQTKIPAWIKITSLISSVFIIGFCIFAINQYKQNNLLERNMSLLRKENNSLKDKNTEIQRDFEQIKETLKEEIDSKYIGSFESGRELYFSNNCSYPIKLSLSYKSLSGDWETNGWWSFNSNESAYLASSGNRIQLSDPIFYYYAEITKGQIIYSWRGEKPVYFDNQTLQMRLGLSLPDSDGDLRLSLSCSNL